MGVIFLGLMSVCAFVYCESPISNHIRILPGIAMRAYILFYVLEVCCLFESFDIPVQVFEPSIQNWIVVPNRPQITLEVLHIDGIKSNNRRVQTDVKLCHIPAEHKRATIAMDKILHDIQRREDQGNMFIVCILIGSKSWFVDAGVDIVL
jgi:hypothetical protein